MPSAQRKPILFQSPNRIQMMDSPFMKQRNRLKAWVQGWKVRKLNSLEKFRNMKSQVKEIEDYYGSDRQTGQVDHRVLKARSGYINALITTSNR